MEGVPQPVVIRTGQHVLIEGDDEENPYVARVVRLFGDEDGKQKKAAVRWFVRVSEVPESKLQLLGRAPHPQEVFFYEGKRYEDDVDVESILRPVQVKHLDARAPFPESDEKETLYVKLSWDSKAFKVVDSAQVDSNSRPALPPPKPSLPPSPPASPPVATPTSRGPPRRALPTPDLEVMRRATSGEAKNHRATSSVGKCTAEAESLHSATKLSSSKCLSAIRRSASARTPGVRKKLELCSPEKTLMLREDALRQLLDEDVSLAPRRLSSPLSPPPAVSLTPLRKIHRDPRQDAIPLKQSAVVLRKVSLTDEDESSRCAGVVSEAVSLHTAPVTLPGGASLAQSITAAPGRLPLSLAVLFSVYGNRKVLFRGEGWSSVACLPVGLTGEMQPAHPGTAAMFWAFVADGSKLPVLDVAVSDSNVRKLLTWSHVLVVLAHSCWSGDRDPVMLPLRHIDSS